MARAIKVVVKLAIGAFIGMIIEGCILRDPWVELGNGYNVGAVSQGSRCDLAYWESTDPRPPSAWIAWRGEDSLVIYNRNTKETRDYETEGAWWQARRELGARQQGATMAGHVTAFNVDERYAIGDCYEGFFLLDKQDDFLQTWPTRTVWATEVRSRTTLDPNRLHDPKAWHVQYRPAGYWVIMGSYVALIVAWVLIPLMPGFKRYDFRFTRRGGW